MTFFLGVLLCANAVLSWGTRGHIMVGKIAMEFLNDNAKSYLNEVIPEGKGDLGDVANWADDIKNRRVFGNQWLWASELHFVSVLAMPARDCNYDDDRDCKNGKCIVGAIQNYTERASCRSGSRPSIEEQNVAVKFLSHFLGDISQPLHNCNRSRGGNDITVTFDGKTINGINRPMNLHGIWDFEIVDKLLATQYEDKIENMISDVVTEIKQGSFQRESTSWISSHSVFDRSANGNSMAAIDWSKDANGWNCVNVWQPVDDDPGQDFGGAYYEKAWPAVRIQIAKAGYRLAHQINEIFDTCSTSTPVPSVTPLVSVTSIASDSTTTEEIAIATATSIASDMTETENSGMPTTSSTPDEESRSKPNLQQDPAPKHAPAPNHAPETYPEGLYGDTTLSSASCYSVAGLLALIALL
jgi:hypothetical protein